MRSHFLCWVSLHSIQPTITDPFNVGDRLYIRYKARKYVMAKSEIDTFPQEFPYCLEQLLDEDWFP